MASSCYEHWNLGQLRDELRRRNARISGRKTELVERLEAYDRNANFGNCPNTIPSSDFTMLLPDMSLYKDATIAMKLPKMTQLKVNDYLTSLGNEITDTESLYNSGFITYMRAAVDNSSVFVRCQCCAEMHKGVSYIVDLKLADNRFVQETQCECAAGIGPTAHCKHVRASLFALHDFTTNGKLNLKLTCTQKLQNFHRAKPYLGSPLKAASLKEGRLANSNMSETRGIHFDPCPSPQIASKAYESFVRNTTINFLASQNRTVSIPLSQLYEPANVHAIENDHDYTAKSLSEQFLENLGIFKVCSEQVAKIEEQTRGQSSNNSWHLERCFRLHASKFGEICKTQNQLKLAKELVTLKRLNVPAVRHGLKYEQKVIADFSLKYGVTVARSGILVAIEHPYLACSPDGLCDEYVVEVKCPYSAKYAQINPETIPYLFLDEHIGLYMLDKSHNYYYQIQGLMFITGKSQCCFIVYTLCDRYDVLIPRDDEFIKQMCEKLQVFFSEVFRKVVLDKFLYRTIDKQ